MTSGGPIESEKGALFLAGDPGGANALLPVIKGWRNASTVFAYRQAIEIFEDAGVAVERLDDAHAASVEAEALLAQKRPDVVCTATSANGVDWERHFIVAARTIGIPSVAILDYWSNYAARFTLAQKLDALPDMIGIMDERARTEMVSSGFPAERLSVIGQPVLDEARRWSAGLPAGSRGRLRAEMGVAEETRVFLFVSQPLREMRRTVGQNPGPQDDEYACLEKLIEAIAEAPLTSKLLLIKLHPREPVDKYEDQLSSSDFPIRVAGAQDHRWELCIAADVIFGMDSMLMEEALVMGCAVERIQPREPLNLAGSRSASSPNPAKAVPLATALISQLLTARPGAKAPGSA